MLLTVLLVASNSLLTVVGGGRETLSASGALGYNYYRMAAKMAGYEDDKQAAFPLTAADLWRELENRAFIIPTGCNK